MNKRIAKIIELIKEVKPSIEELDENTIINQGLLDSLDIMTLIELMEDEFSVEIAGVCLKQENFETVVSLLQMIEDIEREG